MTTTSTVPYDERWSPAAVEECSQLWNLTTHEQEALLQLKEKLSDVDHWKNDPFEVVRFLMEFKFDVKTAEHKIRASVAWRRAHKADSILEDYGPPQLYNYFPLGVLEGADREGDPIYIERTGAADSLGLLHRFGKEEMIQEAIWGKEMVLRGPWLDSWPHGRVKRMTSILDMKGLNRSHLHPSLVPVGQAVTRLTQDNYPGVAKKILVIRAPFFFRFAWNIFKHFVDPHVRDMLEIATEKETPDLLEKYMDLSVLPKEIIPQGKGRAAPGFDPVWEGGTLPHPTNDDWKRIPPVRADNVATESESTPLLKTPPIPFTTTTTTTTEESTVSWESLPAPKPEVLNTPLQPTTSGETQDTGKSWESLPEVTPTRNIQQAWTVTPGQAYDLQEIWNPSTLDDVAQLWQLDETEQNQMLILKDDMLDIHHHKNNPYEVVRFLKHNHGNTHKAEHQFRKMIIWRLEHKMDHFLTNFYPINPLFQYMPICVMKGLDKDGDPIFIDRMGACDYHSLYRHFGPDPMVDYVTFLRELNSCPQFWQPYQDQVGHRVKSYTVIIDLEGLTAGHMRPALLKLLQRTAKISQEYYAGWAKRILVIRAPPVFKLVWSVVKKYFAPQVHSRIEFSQGHDHMALLDQYMDRSVLPSVICPEGKGEPMPGYYENVKLEGGPIPAEAFREDTTSVPLTTPPALKAKRRSTPVATTSLLLGQYEEEPSTQKGDDSETSIRAFASPPKPAFQSPMFKYNW